MGKFLAEMASYLLRCQGLLEFVTCQTPGHLQGPLLQQRQRWAHLHAPCDQQERGEAWDWRLVEWRERLSERQLE